MIDFKDVLENPEKYAPKPISTRDQKLEIGMRVRCYEQDSDDMQHFVGYGDIEEIYPGNQAWVHDSESRINYQYWVIPHTVSPK